MTTPGELLAQRPHTALPGDVYDDPSYQAPSEATDWLATLLEQAADDDLKLTAFQRYWTSLQGNVLRNSSKVWKLGGPTVDSAATVANIVTAGQITGSHLTQLYAARHFGAEFTPFDPGPDIIERPSADKLTVYSRPIRERSLESQLSRLETLANTDLQLSKVRTLYSAFDEDQSNGHPIRIYKRVTSGEKPCALCEIAADQVYFTTDLMAIHDSCMCDVEEGSEEDLDEKKMARHHIRLGERLLDIGEQKEDIQALADDDAPDEDYHKLVKVEQHGDLGPVIVWAKQQFTGPRDLPNPLPLRPDPALSRHGERLSRNDQRVNDYRAQQFGPGGRKAPQYHAEHGKGSTAIDQLNRMHAAVGMPTLQDLLEDSKGVGP